MKEQIIASGSKEDKYKLLLPQITALVNSESDMIANMANISAALKQAFDFLWVGFYVVKKEELVLAPFQGKVACTRIKYGKGVCGTSWKERKTIIVANVHECENHITCDSSSVSEIVVPLTKGGKVVAVLDIDSEFENNFDEIDKIYLEQMVDIIPL